MRRISLSLMIVLCWLPLITGPASTVLANVEIKLRAVPDVCKPYLESPPPYAWKDTEYIEEGEKLAREGNQTGAIAQYCAAFMLDSDGRGFKALLHSFDRLGDKTAIGQLEEAIKQTSRIRASAEYDSARYGGCTDRFENCLAQRTRAAKQRDARQISILNEYRRVLESDQQEEALAHADLARAEQHQKAGAGEQAAFVAFLRKYGATDMSNWNASYKLSVNPFSYQGKRVFLSGQYHKNISRHKAIVTILPDIVVWQTSRNLADGSPFVRCVVKVLGTTYVLQGGLEREVPHVQEIECLR